jgi:hypothetical protein
MRGGYLALWSRSQLQLVKPGNGAFPIVATHFHAGLQTAAKVGRRGSPNSAQRKSGSNCTQGTPAALPSGIPGIGVVMEGAMQQAAQPGRQESVMVGLGAR